MNVQVLPHIFKKIGLFLFLTGISIPFLAGVLNPFEDNETISLTNTYRYLLEAGFLLGIVFYFLSKEKIEDELVKKLRSEAFSLTFLLSAASLLVIHSFGDSESLVSNINATALISLQILIFLIIFYFKKRSFDL